MKFIVFAEKNGQTALELCAKLHSIAPEAAIAILGEEGCSSAKAFAGCGADELIHIPYCEDDCAQAEHIADALKQLEPDGALFPATIRGRFISAWVAARMDTGLTADCTNLEMADGLLKQIRPAFGGNLTAQILCKTRRPQLASVRPGVFPLPELPSDCAAIPESTLMLPEVTALLKQLRFTPNESGVSLQGARVIVAGGKGIGSAKGFQKLQKLADLLGGTLGATRSAVDAGWIDYAHQIGQTGVVVHPELYIAVGISGLIQHTVGMSASKTVIAVNTDRNAPIFKCADYGVVADWETTVDLMIKALENQ